MIIIKSTNKCKLLKPELIKKDTLLLNKYNLWLNTNIKPNLICFSKTFGKHSTFFIGFDLLNNEVEYFCTTFSGITTLVFNEKDIENTFNILDKQCMAFAINFLKELNNHKIIELEDD